MKHASRPRSTSRLRVTLAAGGAGLVVLSGLFIGSGSAAAASPDGRAAVTACAGDVVTVPASSFVTQDGVTTFANYLLPTTTVVTTQKYILGVDGTPITSTVTSSVDTATGAMTVTIPAAETRRSACSSSPT